MIINSFVCKARGINMGRKIRIDIGGYKFEVNQDSWWLIKYANELLMLSVFKQSVCKHCISAWITGNYVLMKCLN